jgi:hypothetical protein
MFNQVVVNRIERRVITKVEAVHFGTALRITREGYQDDRLIRFRSDIFPQIVGNRLKLFR